MLLERFALWEARHERVHAYSQGMTPAACALPSACSTTRSSSSSTSRSLRSTRAGTALLDAELAGLAGTRTLVVSTHDPARLERYATSRLALA